ncbi:MAG TPA: hypothetical protein VII60_02620 [Acidimicrobiales bacterium]
MSSPLVTASNERRRGLRKARMSQSNVSSAALLRGIAMVSLLVTLLLSAVNVSASSAAATSPNQLFQIAMGNAGQKKFVVINMSGNSGTGTYRDVWRSNPHSGSLVRSVDNASGTGHESITVLNRVVYEKIDTNEWAYAGLGAKYKNYENRWFMISDKTSTYKEDLQQEETSGALLIPIDGTQFTIKSTAVFHGAKVTVLKGALVGSNPAVPVTLIVSTAKNPLPLEVTVPATSKNKDVWTATYSYRTSASPIAQPTTSLTFP